MTDPICLDLETCLIRPGLCAPPVSVCSLYHPDTGPQLFGTFELEPEAEKALQRTVVGHNIAYDMLCLFEWYPRLRPTIVQAYQEGRVLDTGLLWRLVEISKGDMRGGLALDRLCQLVGLKHTSKHETDEEGQELRLGFGKHWGTDLSGLSAAEVQYCQDDVVLCWQLFQRVWSKGLVSHSDLAKLGRTDFALKAISAFGLRADPEIVESLEQQARAEIAALTTRAVDRGFARIEKGRAVRTVRAIQQAVADVYRIPVQGGEGRNRNKLYPADGWTDHGTGLLTDTGAVSTSKGVLRESGDVDLVALADYQEWSAVLNKDVKLFKEGVFHTRFGYANTLRTTSSGPNIQNFRKKAGVRECIRARFGCFVASDYTGLENATLAELVFRYTGRRGMADRITAGFDFHCEVGRLIDPRGLDYDSFKALVKAGEPAAVLARGAAKPANFGLAGNMRKPETFQAYARDGYGVHMSVERAAEIMQVWWDSQHDQMAYLQHIESFHTDPNDRYSLYSVPIPGTDIIRLGATSCAAANTGFQALGMQVAADALWLLVTGQLLGRIPGKACAFVHDEIISDCAPSDRDEVAFHQERCMLEAAEKNLEVVKMSVETQCFDRWTKKFPAGWQHKNPDGTLNLYEVPRGV